MANRFDKYLQPAPVGPSPLPSAAVSGTTVAPMAAPEPAPLPPEPVAAAPAQPVAETPPPAAQAPATAPVNRFSKYAAAPAAPAPAAPSGAGLPLDKSTGSPFSERVLVDSAERPEDQLATLRTLHPDAQKALTVEGGEGNYEYTSSDGRRMLHNPPGLDRGDFGGYARMGAQTVGGIVGGVAGAPAGPGGALVAGGVGSATGGQLFDTIASALGGQVNSKTLPERATEFGTDAVMDTAAGGVGALVGKGVRWAGHGIADAVRRVLGGGTPEASRKLADATAAGITPTGSLVGDSAAMHGGATALSNIPSSANRMETASKKTVDEIGGVASDLARRYGAPEVPGSQQEIGGMMRAGAEAGASRFRTQQDSLYTEAYNRIGRTTPTPVNNVATLRDDLRQLVEQAPSSFAPNVGAVLKRVNGLFKDAVQPGVGASGPPAIPALPFDTLRHIRTELGRELDAPAIMGGTPAQQAQLKRLYGALTEDLNAAARSAGPDAAAAMARANAHTNYHMSNNADFLKAVDKKAHDEDVFNLVMKGHKAGGSQLADLRRNVSEKEWGRISGSILGRMGLAKAAGQDASGEAFSAATFLTNWDNMAPEAKKVLFREGKNSALAPELDRLVRIANDAKATSKLANTSGTARPLLYMQVLGGVGASFVSPVAGGLGLAATTVPPWAAAKLITSPRFARWLAQSVTVHASISPNGIAAQIGRLKSIASENPDIADAVGEYIGALQSSTTQPEQKGQQ